MKIPNTDNSKNGSAMLIVLSIVVSMSALLIVSVSGGLQQAFFATKLADRVRAQLIAEAGAHQAYMLLKSDWDARLTDTAFPLTSYGDGSYDVEVAPTNAMASIRSTGTYGAATELAILDVINLGSSSPAVPVDWSTISNYTVVAGGEVTFTGTGHFEGGGLLHSNGKFTKSGNGELDANITSSVQVHIQGNAGSIDGDVSAPSVTGKTGNISPSPTEGSIQLVNIPDIDLTPFATEAAANDEYYSTDQTLNGTTTIDGGVMFVDGNLTITGSGTLTGSFISTGTLTVSGQVTIIPVDGYPALASRDGDIKVSGGSEIEGLIYVKSGDYEQTGGSSLAGQIVVKGDIKKAGNTMNVEFVNSPPTIPGGTPSTETDLGLNTWQR
ncbi:MAG: cytoskeletal protein CcmA (bactofilin family) [Candidatus Promineifilaceae bacterium]|jgi:cytoskeletal protein CcmA (bactofilin family)